MIKSKLEQQIYAPLTDFAFNLYMIIVKILIVHIHMMLLKSDLAIIFKEVFFIILGSCHKGDECHFSHNIHNFTICKYLLVI